MEKFSTFVPRNYAKSKRRNLREKMGEMLRKISAKDFAQGENITVDALRARWNALRANGSEDFRLPFDRNAELSAAQISALAKARRAASPIAPTPKPAPPAPKPVEVPRPAPRRAWTVRQYILLLLLLAPTSASVGNMYRITAHIAGNSTDAGLLTSVLACSAIGFVIAGIRSMWAISLAVLLIAFESFCNLTRIYGGLMGVGQTGNPTRFLGLVTDIFGSGTHQTAIALGAFTAFFIAAVQYAAIFELNKK